MYSQIETLSQEIDTLTIHTPEEAEQARLKYLSRKGIFSQLFSQIGSLPTPERAAIGAKLNALKQKLQEKISSIQNTNQQLSETFDFDYTLSAKPLHQGKLHPLTLVEKELIQIFERMGYVVAEGPEIETDWYNFSALNFEPHHPARDMQDTFFISLNPDILLRTHTSSVQVRVMEKQRPPIRIIAVGRVYRNETITARANCLFHQLEVLYVDKNVSMADLKRDLLHFAQEMFGKDTKIRLRASYFPFTEVSAEVDISCTICNGKGCNVCKYTGWVEILGCGMVDPNVLKNVGIDSEMYSGFAAGLGIERIAMLKYQVNDLRLFFENDIRFLQQF
ncbi:MAG: phenylalanine--tRNA ligase subunit alpha [Bacteroidia bacterium]|nr:phenylalanine--tRNA ligase subunit alpha [Bacteroidia bacterium]MDW8300936.1 phenylalanine--tRNA ligase subunit alpha [Bacteroidia bacterium]